MAKKDEYKPFVRSIYNLGDYNDDEVNDQPSMTDPSQDEPIEKLVARLLRGEQVSGSVIHYDTDDITPKGVAGAFESLPPQECDGFDIADAGPILDAARDAIAAATPAPASVPAPALAPVPADLADAPAATEQPAPAPAQPN